MNKISLGFVLLVTACAADDGQQMCGADHCGLQGHTVVKWMFDSYPDWGFAMDSCTDFGVGKVRVDAVDATGATVASKLDDCGAGQVTFEGLPEGDYTMYLAPQDFGGADLVSLPVTGPATAGTFGNDTTTTLMVPWTSWVGTYTGTFLFRLSWAGASCEVATPAVATEDLTLMVNGVVVSATTDTGHKLDGTDPAPCHALSENFPESAKDVPFGPATLIVDGMDVGHSPVFHHEFATFVGAGISNPTLTFDVPFGMM